MKQGIHPEYVEATVHCSCGETFQTRATQSQIRVEICSKCHPFFTGKQKFVDSGGRVQRFQDKFGAYKAPERSEKAEAAEEPVEAEAAQAGEAPEEAPASETSAALEGSSAVETEAPADEAPADEALAEPEAQTSE